MPAWVEELMEEKRQWLILNPHGDCKQSYPGEFIEEEQKMATQIHIVMAKKHGTESILRVCSDKEDARQKSRNTPVEEGTTWVMSYNVEDPVVIATYRVWVKFEEDGPKFEAFVRSSIPMVKDVFEPMEPQAKSHGSITVDASSEEDAIAKAKNILFAYLTGGPVAQEAKSVVPRR